MGAGLGTIRGPGRVSVEKDGKKSEIEAANILMVSGSEARALPGIEPDHKTILTNRSILELPEIPKTLIVVGAGAVGVEFASIYNSFGTQVTILEALPRVVPVEDEEISAELEKDVQEEGHSDFHRAAKWSRVKKDAKGVTVSFKDKDGKAQTLQAEKLLLAVGRKPMTENCGLEKSKAKLERGFVHVGRIHGDGRERAVRHRRYRRGNAATGARGDDGRDRRGDAHRREADAADSEERGFRMRRTASRRSGRSD